jgi:hypothetical protein
MVNRISAILAYPGDRLYSDNGNRLPSGATNYKHADEDFCYGEFDLGKYEYN